MSSSGEISLFHAFSYLGRNGKNGERKNRREARREKAIKQKVVPVYQNLVYPLIGSF